MRMQNATARCSLVFSLALMMSAGLVAAAPEPAVKSIGKRDGAVQIAIGDHRLVLRPLKDSAIRVQYSTGVVASTPDFVLLPNRTVAKFSVREHQQSITVVAAKIQAAVDRATAAIRSRNAAGNVFLAEKPGTRELEPVTVQGQQLLEVEQEFESPAGEKLFGPGQFQEGLWNWRGVPLELR